MTGAALPLISTQEQTTSQALRRRVLAQLNGAPSAEDLRKAAKP